MTHNFIFRDDDPRQGQVVVVKADDTEYKYTKPDNTIGVVTGKQLYACLGGKEQEKLQRFGSNILLSTNAYDKQIWYKVALPDYGATLSWVDRTCTCEGNATMPVSIRCIPGIVRGNSKHGALAINEFYIPFVVTYPAYQDMFSRKEGSICLEFGINKFIKGKQDKENTLSPIMIWRPRMLEDDILSAVFMYDQHTVGQTYNSYVYDMRFNTYTGYMTLINRKNPEDIIRSKLRRLE